MSQPTRRKKVIYHYTVVFEREPDGGYHAFCPALKGCHSQGDNYEDAVKNVKEATRSFWANQMKRASLYPCTKASPSNPKHSPVSFTIWGSRQKSSNRCFDLYAS